MIKSKFPSFYLIFLLILLSACSNPKMEDRKVELTVSAAASMQEALADIQKIYEKENNQVKILFNFGSSGALQQQIAQGAPVDLFLSAAEDKFDDLVIKDFIDKKESVELVGNELVLIQKKNKKNVILERFSDLTDDSVIRISIGTPETVPAGKYAKETLEHLNLWNQLENKTVFAKDVRQVLTYVETGNVDAGIVYKTDALLSPKIEIIAIADKTSHSPIIYPLGIIKNSKHKEEAKRFYEFLQSEHAVEIFKEYGFTTFIK
jgi:molybdate transport system substrate-binding protein